MKKLIFYLVGFTLTYVLMEVCYFGMYRLANHHYFSFEAEREALNKVLTDVQIDQFGQKIVGVTPSSADIMLHPYLGFGPPDGLYEYAKNKSEIMVGITGASVAQIFYHDKTAIDELKKYISAIPIYKGRPVHVVCLAVGAYKQPQQSIAVMLYLMFGGRLDILINLDGQNDMYWPEANQAAKIFYGYPSLYFWKDVVSPFRSLEDYHAIGRLTALRILRQKWANVFESITPLRYSVTALTLWEYGDRAFANRINDVQQLMKSIKQDNRIEAGPYASMTKEDLLNRSGDLWMESSLYIQQMSEMRGFHYYHFLQPVPNLPGTKPFSEEEKRVAVKQYAIKDETIYYGKLADEIPKLQNQHVKIYNITDIFSKTPESIYVDSCCHVNHAGNMMFARKFGETIAGDSATWKP